MKKIIPSKDIIDRRIVDLVRVQQASYIGLKLGFKGLNFQEHEEESRQEETYLAGQAKTKVSAVYNQSQ